MPRAKRPAEPHTVRDYVHWSEQRFRQARLYFGHGTDNARDEAAWLVANRLDIPFERLDQEADRTLTVAEADNVRTLTDARITTRKPLAYLLHEAWFAGHRFYIDERAIVPRSLIGDFLPDRFQPWIKPVNVHRILDLCTGSGCIAVAAALAFPEAQVDAVDLSPDALAVAQINVEAHQMSDRVQLIASDLFQQLMGRRYDLILTNPPYVDARDMATLPREFRHEPPLALAAGPSGLDVIVRILAEAADYLNPGGVLIAEVGNSCTALQREFPQVRFVWLTAASGDESVFLLGRDELARHTGQFRAAQPRFSSAAGA